MQTMVSSLPRPSALLPLASKGDGNQRTQSPRPLPACSTAYGPDDLLDACVLPFPQFLYASLLLPPRRGLFLRWSDWILQLTGVHHLRTSSPPSRWHAVAVLHPWSNRLLNSCLQSPQANGARLMRSHVSFKVVSRDKSFVAKPTLIRSLACMHPFMYDDKVGGMPELLAAVVTNIGFLI